MRRLAVIICSLLLALAAHAQDASVLLAYVTAGEEVAWTPLDLGAKLACWFDADDASTLLDAGGDPADDAEDVQTWLDKSGNARHATAPEEAQRPTRQVGVQNGRAVVRTDGGDTLSIANVAPVFRNKTAGYIFTIAKDANQAAGDANHCLLMFFRNVVNSGRAAIYSRASPDAKWLASGRRLDADFVRDARVTADAGYVALVSFFDWSGGYVRVRTHGGEYVSSDVMWSSGAGATSDTDGAGGFIFWANATYNMPANSEIAEIIVVNADMSAAEIAATERYLKAKWGTP